jgi:predicted dinucleotide-binding enzyme
MIPIAPRGCYSGPVSRSGCVVRSGQAAADPPGAESGQAEGQPEVDSEAVQSAYAEGVKGCLTGFTAEFLREAEEKGHEPDPRHQAGRQVLFLAGDDADAKTTVKDLTAAFGFAPVDLGSLREGGRLMQLGGPLSGLHALKQD